VPNNIFSELKPLQNFLQIINANGTTVIQLTTTTDRSQRWDTILLTNTDTIAHVVRLFTHIATTQVLLGSISVPAGAGTLGAPPVELLAALFASTGQGCVLNQGNYLMISVEVAVVATFSLFVAAFGGEL
jgi:hypothetical protein